MQATGRNDPPILYGAKLLVRLFTCTALTSTTKSKIIPNLLKITYLLTNYQDVFLEYSLCPWRWQLLALSQESLLFFTDFNAALLKIAEFIQTKMPLQEFSMSHTFCYFRREQKRKSSAELLQNPIFVLGFVVLYPLLLCGRRTECK